MVSCSAARERLRAEPRCALCIRVRGQAFNDGVFVDKVPRLKAKRRAHQIVRPARHEERESREREIGGIKPHKGINREFGARTQNSSTAFSVLAESRSSAEGSSAARGEPPAIARASSGFLSFWTSKSERRLMIGHRHAHQPRAGANRRQHIIELFSRQHPNQPFWRLLHGFKE